MRRILTEYRQAFSGLPRTTWLLCLTTLVNRSGTMVLPFLVLYLTSEKGFDKSQAGLFLSLYGAGAIAGSSLGGMLADRIGALTVQRFSLLLTGVGFALLGTLEQPVAIGATLLLLSVVAEAFRPANGAYLASTCSGELRVRAMALNRLAINLGMAIGPSIGGFLAVIGYGWLFLVDALTCGLAAVLLFVAFRREPVAIADVADDPGADRGPWRDGLFLLCMTAVLIICVIFMQTMSTLPLYWHEEYGLTEDRIGLLFAINPILIVLLEMILVHRLQGRSPLRVIAVGAAFIGIGFGIMPLGAGIPFAAFTVVIWTLGEMLESPFMGGFVANRAGDRSRGRYMGVYMLTFSISLVVAPALGTLVYERLGPDTLWYGCGLFALVAAALQLLLARRLDRPGRTLS